MLDGRVWCQSKALKKESKLTNSDPALVTWGGDIKGQRSHAGTFMEKINSLWGVKRSDILLPDDENQLPSLRKIKTSVQSRKCGRVRRDIITIMFKMRIFRKINRNNIFKRVVVVRHVHSEIEATNCSSSQVKTSHDIPGPSIFPTIKNLHHHLPGGSLYEYKGYEFHKYLLDTYGEIVKIKIVSGRSFLYLFDPNSAEMIFRNENVMPVRPLFESMDFYRKVYKKSNSDEPTGLLSDQGEVWKKLRSLVNPILMQPKTILLYSNILDEIACDMVGRLKSLRDKNNKIEDTFSSEMCLWALESISAVAFGRRLYCFNNILKENSPEKELLQCIQNIFIVTEKLDFYPSLWKYYPTKTFKKSMHLQDELERLCVYFINKTIDDHKTKQKLTSEISVLEKIMAIEKKVAIVIASDMLFAGVETTSSAVMITLYHLATNPEKQIKLREEISSQHFNGPYLRACIKESMRLLPVSSGSMRLTTKEYNVLGYHIPKNMCIIYPHHVLCRMESQYPRSLDFIPERWLADKTDPLHYGTADVFSYLPFGFGARSCIGRRIVELEMKCILARIIENFEVEWIGPPPKVKHTIITYLTKPNNFIFKDV